MRNVGISDLVGQHKRSVAGAANTPGTAEPHPGLLTADFLSSHINELRNTYSNDDEG